jgi:glycosyltransferase involved in cell wall biosynthesis
MRTAIVAIFKNESEYVLEWIAYHRAIIGINDFIIADNISDDGTTQLLEALEQAGVIKRIVFPRESESAGPQIPAYNHILEQFKSQYDYFLFIDADEFLVNNTGKSLEGYLAEAAEKDNFGAISLNWQIFGSSGNSYKQNGLVTEIFYRASKKNQRVNCHTKSLVSSTAIQKMYIHHADLKENFICYDETLQQTIFLDQPLDTISCEGTRTTPFTKDIKNNLFYIAHFAVKSKYEHFLKKAARGSAGGMSSRQKGQLYFKIHDLNDDTCLDLKKHTDTIADEIKSLKRILQTETLYFSYCNAYIDKKHERFSGWIYSETQLPVTLCFLIDDKKIMELPLNAVRKDVVSKGLSNQENCGFNYLWSDIGIYKESLKVWIKSSNLVIFEANIS